MALLRNPQQPNFLATGLTSPLEVNHRNSSSAFNQFCPGEGVIIRAGFSLLPAEITRTCFKAKYEPSPAHKDPRTDSARLSAQIKDFLKRSDHLEESWETVNGRKSKSECSKTSSAFKNFPLRHSNKSCSTLDDLSFSNSHQRSTTNSLTECSINADISDEVNEFTAELSEEQTSTSIISEKLERESNEKANLETQLTQLQKYCANLEGEKNQLELDLAYSISDLNGETHSDHEEDFLYKQRWERCKRELEIQKQRLKQSEQDHLDQVITLKKSLERKCNDAFEEAEEQRQIVVQLKRKIQKLHSELSDVRCLLQEESSKAALLERKQRRFDNDLANVNSALEKERSNREKVCRERDTGTAQLETLNNELHFLKVDLQLKDTKVQQLEHELETASEMGGNSEQISTLRKSKNELTMKVKDQEEELDDMAGQIQSLEATKVRLEMQLEQMRKEYKKESQRREEELEDVRSAAQKKVKALQCQLESEHEERSAILRSKQEFEKKLYDLEEVSHNRTASQEQLSRLKKELKGTKALLKDAQVLLEQSKNDALNKGMLRQLRHQLEDSESQRNRIMRAKQKVEDELQDALQHLEEISRSKTEAENARNTLLREKNQVIGQLEENEEQLSEVMRKYKATVEQLSVEQSTLAEQCVQISELESVNANLKQTVAELNSKLESLEGEQISQQAQKRFNLKVRELETRMELEVTTKGRLEGQVARLKEHLGKLQDDLKTVQTRESLGIDKYRKAERQLRECRDEVSRLAQKDADNQLKKNTLEKQLESANLEITTLKNDLKLSIQRIEDLTAAIKEAEEFSDNDSTESLNSDTDTSDVLALAIR